MGRKMRLLLTRYYLLLITVSFIGCVVIEVDEPEITFSKTFGFDYFATGESVKQTADGGYIVVGTINTYHTLADLWLLKTDQNGDAEWSIRFGGSGFDYGKVVNLTDDGGYIIGGYTESQGNGLKDAWIIKTDSSGSVEWEQTFGFSNEDYCYDIIQTDDKGYILCGAVTMPGYSQCDIWIIKTDGSGNEEWNASFGYTNSADQGFSILETMNGDYVITGYSSPGIYGFADLRILKIDNGGNLIWDKQFGGNDYDEGYCTVETSDGGYAIAGTPESYGNGLDDFWLIRTDSMGVVEWDRIYGGDQRDEISAVIETVDGGFTMVGKTNSFGTGDYNVWAINTDGNGNVIWDRTYGGELDDGGKSICQTTDGGFIITGFTYSFGTGNGDLWLLKIDGDGYY